MLLNQNFVPNFLIGVGPELFFSSNSANGIDYKVLHELRQLHHKFTSSGFTMLYAGKPKSSVFADLSVLFNHLDLFGLVEWHHLLETPFDEYQRAFLETLDLLYSPELVGKEPIQSAVKCNKEDFLNTLASYTSGEPFSRPNFFSKIAIYG